MSEQIYRRSIEELFKARLFDEKKISIIYGPRQVGKTTFAKQILKFYDSEGGYFNCEELVPKEALMSGNPDTMYAMFSGHRVIVLDEAQTVPDIGRALKILIDAHPEMTIIATGSSSFDLANKVNEPLTGRHYEYFLYPLSLAEYRENFSMAMLTANMESLMLFGGYPGVVSAESVADKVLTLKTLATSYLYKDIFTFNNVKNPEVLPKILKALAFQVGSEVSFSEIAQLTGVDKNTVSSYIRLLEQAFVIFRLEPLFSLNNPRNAIKKKPKFYFYDNGLLNAIINNYTIDDARELGPLWENLMVVERRKRNQLVEGFYCNAYFWRLKSGAEVDYIEEYEGKYYPFEFKYNKEKTGRGAQSFEAAYDGLTEEVKIVNKGNFGEFVF